MDLPTLVRHHRDGRSNPELARDAGGVFSDKRMQQLSVGAFKEFPEPKTLAALARALRVSEASVVLAVAESLDLDVGRSPSGLLDLLPAGANELSEGEARAVAAMIYEFTVGRAARRAAGEQPGPVNLRTLDPDAGDDLPTYDFTDDDVLGPLPAKPGELDTDAGPDKGEDSPSGEARPDAS